MKISIILQSMHSTPTYFQIRQDSTDDCYLAYAEDNNDQRKS